MLDLEMTTDGAVAVIRLSGELAGADDADTVTAAVSFVPPDDDLVVDLTGLRHAAAVAVRRVGAGLARRRACAETVIVSDRPEVSVHLILAEVDRWAPVVPSLTDAMTIIRSRSGRRLLDAAEVA